MDTEASGFNTNETVAIIGLGLMGGSFARACGASERSISSLSIPMKRPLQKAKQEGMVDEVYTTGSTALRRARMIIFCTATAVMIRFLAEHKTCFAPGTIVTDVAGIRRYADAIKALLPEGVDFIPGHPMAGREGKGYAMASADIFNNANYILVPMPENKENHLLAVTSMAMALGCAHVVRVSPEKHDRFIAYTSCLPHVLATALVNSESMDPMTKYFVAGSFRDGTRVADINAALWTSLFLANKENLVHEIDCFRKALTDFSTMLSDEDAEGMTRFLQQAAARRRDLVYETHSR